MVITDDTDLPSNEELDVADINLSSATLIAGAHHFGKYCDEPSKEFMLCKTETGDPRACLDLGKEVSNCATEFFGRLKRFCFDEFTKYAQCVDFSDYNMDLRYCRHPQALYDKCVFDKIGQERPPVGYFSKVRIHDSKRPRPVLEKPVYPEPTPDPPDLDNMPDPPTLRWGSRFFGFP